MKVSLLVLFYLFPFICWIGINLSALRLAVMTKIKSEVLGLSTFLCFHSSLYFTTFER